MVSVFGRERVFSGAFCLFGRGVVGLSGVSLMALDAVRCRLTDCESRARVPSSRRIEQAGRFREGRLKLD